MHFKLDLKEKKTMMKKKKKWWKWHFFKIRPLPCPFLLFWRMGHFCLQHLWIDGGTAGKVLPRGQSGVPLMVWKEKWRRGESYLSSSSWAECCFWNLLSGIIRRADFFDFLWLCLLYMNCFCGTHRPPRPPLFSLSWICLISHRQNGGS